MTYHFVVVFGAGVIVDVMCTIEGEALTVRVPVAHLDMLVDWARIDVLVTIMVDVVAKGQRCY